MTERTLADALSHALMLRHFFAQSPQRGGISEKDIVLLADEVLRLHAENDGLKSGRYNTAIALKSDIHGSYGE